MYVCGVQRDYQHYAIIIIDHRSTQYAHLNSQLDGALRFSFFFFCHVCKAKCEWQNEMHTMKNGASEIIIIVTIRQCVRE